MSGIRTFCLLVITAIYCKTFFIVRRHKRQIQQVRELEAQSRQNSEMRNLATIMKTAVGVLYVYFAFLAARVITGPNIVTTSFSLYTHTLMFFNSTLNPVIYGWRIRQIPTPYSGHTTKSKRQSWVVIQDILAFWHSVFHLMFVEIRFWFPLLENFRFRAPFYFVSVRFRKPVRLRPT